MALTKIEFFNFQEGFKLSNKFQIVRKLGEGWEGEVYIVKEIGTGIERAAKIFYPKRNYKNQVARFYAKKLHKLRNCPILIQYLVQETITYLNTHVTFLVSEYVEGPSLSDFLKKTRNKKLPPFQAIHLLHSLAKGLEDIHHMKEYHGDLHPDNIIVQRYGLGFDLKLLDMFHWGHTKPENIKDDVCDLIKIFYDSLGGPKYYYTLPKEIKEICCGLKKSLILQKFKTAGHLRVYLENMCWRK